MSNIIKGGRIRSQGVMNLSERITHKVTPIQSETQDMLAADWVVHKREELLIMEQEMQERIKAASKKHDEILAQAHEKANKIEQEAMLERERILSEVYEKEQSLLRQCEEEIKEKHQAALLEKEQLLQSVEGEVVETMIKLLQHIISEEFNSHSEWLLLVVKKMLSSEKIEGKAVLAVSSLQYKQLTQSDEVLSVTLSKLAEIKEDVELSDTTCKLITPEGCIEYDVQQGLEKVVSELRILQRVTQETS